MTPVLVRSHLDALAKPPGSLGRLEDRVVRLCVTQRTLAPRTTPRRVVLFAADHWPCLLLLRYDVLQFRSTPS